MHTLYLNQIIIRWMQLQLYVLYPINFTELQLKFPNFLHLPSQTNAHFFSRIAIKKQDLPAYIPISLL